MTHCTVSDKMTPDTSNMCHFVMETCDKSFTHPNVADVNVRQDTETAHKRAAQ